MIIIVLLCLCLVTNNYEVDGRIPSISKYEYLNLERQLKLINKPPIKTIQTDFGHTVDCIDINKQLAFDHPLLKNHKLQLKPSFVDTTETMNYVNDRSDRVSQIGIEKDFCPRGTVPIRRTTKDDLIRAKGLSNIAGILTQSFPGQHFAELFLKKNDSYYGVSATIGTYNLTVSSGQMSAAYTWLATGTGDNVNGIFTGWQVYPGIYGDSSTYFFALWLDKTTQAGCINMLCPGFVQVDKSVYLGLPVPQTSTYEGQQFEIVVNITQDPATKNWWLRAENVDVGYFPATLFSNLGTANHGGWTGRTLTTLGTPSPPMGSGHLPDGNPTHACYFRQFTYKDGSGQNREPDFDMVDTFADKPNCYDVKYYGFVSEALENVLLFGGPGGGNCGD